MTSSKKSMMTRTMLSLAGILAFNFLHFGSINPTAAYRKDLTGMVEGTGGDQPLKV